MNLSTLAGSTLISAALLLPAAGQAFELHGKELELYGTFHPSLDYMDSDISEDEADPDNGLTSGSVGVSFNSSNIGFRGVVPTDVDDLSVMYQLEQGINMDGSSSDTFTTRNSFVGLKTSNWQLFAGRHDTLFKDLALRHSLIKHSVADRGVILGASALHGNQMDRRAENMILGRYFLPLGSGRLELQAQYSPDATKSAGTVDNNKEDLLAFGVEWKSPARTFAVAYDHWSNKIISTTVGEVNAWRAMWKETGEHLTTNLILESISHELTDGTDGEMDRDAVALQAAWKQGRLRYVGQIMMADSYADTDDTGATVFSAGVEKSLSKSTKIYTLYTRTDNEDNAAFQGVDGTHGDELKTLPGGSPQALSVGMIFKF